MTLVLENGSGVYGANAYVNAAYVTAYLTERGRVTENSWSTSASSQDAACIAATAHVETRIRARVRGSKRFQDVSLAKALLSMPTNPSAGETVTIGIQVYTFQTVLASTDDVLIGSSASASIDNLVSAIAASSSGAGTLFHASTVENADATAQSFEDDTMIVYAKTTGTAGNGVATTTAVTGASFDFTATQGGSDVVRPQPLSFPRESLYDRDGVKVVGVPELAKWATSEYAVRALPLILSGGLIPDPTLDARGGIVTKVDASVGPIKDVVEYLPGSTAGGRIPSYPAADRFLDPFFRPRKVIR
jgi:hypothetical protein